MQYATSGFAYADNVTKAITSVLDILANDRNENNLTSHESSASSSITDAQSYRSRLVMQHQDMINQHALCLTRLRRSSEIAQNLLKENAHLRSINSDLNNQISLLLQSSIQKHRVSSHYDENLCPSELLNQFGSLSIGGNRNEEQYDESPTRMAGGVTRGRVLLPKSVSVRSDGYLKMNQRPTPRVQSVSRPRTAVPLGETKVYVRGKEEEEPVTLEVYNQGMLKTELCNKWQETGACPYEENCQYAHGMGELRPVIRHPRYKTEVCRMVLSGDHCPYGHRCHFRHALTDEERSFTSRVTRYN